MISAGIMAERMRATSPMAKRATTEMTYIGTAKCHSFAPNSMRTPTVFNAHET